MAITAALAVAAAVLSAPASASVGIAASAGTMGLGLALALPIVPGVFNARLLANGGRLHHTFGVGGLAYGATGRFRNAALLGDYYPFEDLFHISAGVYYNDNAVNLRAIPDHGYYNIDGFSAPAALVGPVSGQVTFARFAPYFGLGWGNMATGRRGLVFGADIGVMWQRPHTTLSAPGAASNPDLAVALQDARDQVQNVANRFRFYPVVTVSLGYRF
ncbi:MAG: hypothetical protein M0Z76_09925 [Gammaproteobacteria bacterium]|nr:hypothetical protein [Gammaproteobacteria bacterium]